MEMVDVVITKMWFSGQKSRSVNIFSSGRFCLLFGAVACLEASRPTYWGVWGAEPPRKKGSYILHVSVVCTSQCGVDHKSSRGEGKQHKLYTKAHHEGDQGTLPDLPAIFWRPKQRDLPVVG